MIELHGNLIDGAWDTKGTAQADINLDQTFIQLVDHSSLKNIQQRF